MSEAPYQFKTTKGEVYRDAEGQRRRTVIIERDKKAEAESVAKAAALPTESPRDRARK